MRLLVLINPKASRAQAALPSLQQWFEAQPDARLIVAQSHHDLRQSLREFGPSADRIIVGGGDGTLSSALRELLMLDKPLGILPLGTANDLARTLSLPDHPLAAAEVALQGREHRIDIGVVNERPFLNVASVGIASNVSRAQNAERKRTWAKLSYVIAFREVIRKARPFYVWITLDNKTHWKGMAHQVSVGNGRFHGGGLIVAEHAAIDDGELNVYVVRPGTLLQLVACLATLKLGFGRGLDALMQTPAREVRIRTSHPKPVDVDGDIKAETPSSVTILRHALRVIIPNR